MISAPDSLFEYRSFRFLQMHALDGLEKVSSTVGLRSINCSDQRDQRGREGEREIGESETNIFKLNEQFILDRRSHYYLLWLFVYILDLFTKCFRRW